MMTLKTDKPEMLHLKQIPYITLSKKYFSPWENRKTCSKMISKLRDNYELRFEHEDISRGSIWC